MTTTDPQTVSAFLAAITAEPDNDTPRLAFADYLEENGEADRAEFIRVQCRIARLQYGCWCAGCRPDGQHHNGPCAVNKERDEFPDGHSKNAYLRHRCNELLAAHPEWSRLPCPECDGKGPWTHGPLCQVCTATGDLLVATDGDAHTGRIVQFRRGFIDSVSCALSEVLGPEAEYICLTCRNQGYVHHLGEFRRLCPACSGGGGLGRQVVQPWAKAVMRTCPTITRLNAEGHAHYSRVGPGYADYDDYCHHLADLAREAACES